MLIYKVIRPKDTVIVGIIKHKTTHKYHFINFTKEHICSCEFNTIQDAINDLERYKKLGKIIDYIPQKKFIMPYTEKTEISKPLDWLNEESWNYLADYCDEYDYHYYDTLYAYIQGEIESKDLIEADFELITKEEALKKYNEGFPKVLANGLINIANSIIDEDLILKFTTE